MKRSSVLILKLLLIALINLPLSMLKAQEITGVEIYPENIGNTDEVLLMITSSFALTDCQLDSVNTFYACGAFAFDGFYSTAFEIGDCERTDTISLGVLPDGPYLISYRMYFLGWSQVDQVDTFITVGTTGLEHLSGNDASISIWPNPAKGMINIKTEKSSIDRILLRSISGSFSQTIELSGQSPYSLNTISLPAGMYICTSFRNDHPISINKFIVLE